LAQAPAAAPSPAPVSPVEATPPAPKIDPVETTIAAVEKEYQAGQVNYTAGHLEAAKDNFDRAFDMLLMGPAEVKSEDRLQQEFDKIVEGIHQLELLALREGDGFTERQAEPAPIDEANEVTFPVDPNIKAQAEQELKTTQSDLPLTLNDAVAAYINYFSSKGRHFLEHGYVRAGRYREMILDTLREEGVPQDLIYLAQAESGFQPLALSRAGARGMWQFMAGRGSQYGLERNWWVDERQDPEKATRAAARHLKDLYNQFGDWYLVMAAYNSGPGTVQRAVERTGYADYWELHRRGVLPAETRNYVPIILAITIMSKNPSQYGLDRLLPDQALAADSLTIAYPVDLRLVAECVDAPLAVLQDLNPSLLRLTTPKDQPFSLRLPAGSKEKFQEAIKAVPVDMRVWWHYHRVSAGESLAEIARKYRTTSSVIEAVNELKEGPLPVDKKLLIPVTPGRHDPDATALSRQATHYKVRHGDTALSVADRFGVPIEDLRQWNRLRGNTLTAGHVLLIYRPTGATAAHKGNPKPKAQATAEGRRATAGGKRQQGQPQEARAPVSRSGAKTAVRAAADRRTHPKGKAVVHRVKKGETLSSIASAYNVSVGDLRRYNPKGAVSLRAGTILIIKQAE
jgi:membrane-bound lytic murein transglycosylase D